MPPEFKRLQHLALKVRDIQKSLKFYDPSASGTQTGSEVIFSPLSI